MAIRNRQMTRAGSAPRLVRDETPKLFRLQDAGYDDARHGGRRRVGLPQRIDTPRRLHACVAGLLGALRRGVGNFVYRAASELATGPN